MQVRTRNQRHGSFLFEFSTYEPLNQKPVTLNISDLAAGEVRLQANSLPQRLSVAQMSSSGADPQHYQLESGTRAPGLRSNR